MTTCGHSVKIFVLKFLNFSFFIYLITRVQGLVIFQKEKFLIADLERRLLQLLILVNYSLKCVVKYLENFSSNFL